MEEEMLEAQERAFRRMPRNIPQVPVGRRGDDSRDWPDNDRMALALLKAHPGVR